MAAAQQKHGPEKGSRGLLLGYLAAALGLPSAWAALKWPPVTGHPILGIVLLFAAAMLIGLAGLAHQV